MTSHLIQSQFFYDLQTPPSMRAMMSMPTIWSCPCLNSLAETLSSAHLMSSCRSMWHLGQLPFKQLPKNIGLPRGQGVARSWLPLPLGFTLLVFKMPSSWPPLISPASKTPRPWSATSCPSHPQLTSGACVFTPPAIEPSDTCNAASPSSAAVPAQSPGQP